MLPFSGLFPLLKSSEVMLHCRGPLPGPPLPSGTLWSCPDTLDCCTWWAASAPGILWVAAMGPAWHPAEQRTVPAVRSPARARAGASQSVRRVFSLCYVSCFFASAAFWVASLDLSSRLPCNLWESYSSVQSIEYFSFWKVWNLQKSGKNSLVNPSVPYS